MPPTAASGHYNTRNMLRILLYSENTGKICDIDLPEFQLSKRAPTKWVWPSIGKRTRLGERWGWSGHLRDGLRRRGEPHRADRSEHLACFPHTKHPREQFEKNEQTRFYLLSFSLFLIPLLRPIGSQRQRCLWFRSSIGLLSSRRKRCWGQFRRDQNTRSFAPLLRRTRTRQREYERAPWFLVVVWSCSKRESTTYF